MQILFVQHGSGSSIANTVNINQVFIQWQLYPSKTFVDKNLFLCPSKRMFSAFVRSLSQIPTDISYLRAHQKTQQSHHFCWENNDYFPGFQNLKHFFKKVFIIGQMLFLLKSDERISITVFHFLYLVWFISCKKLQYSEGKDHNTR